MASGLESKRVNLMGRHIAGGVFFTFLFTAGLAGASSQPYEMLLNKDKDLCPIMLKLINEDLQQYREIRYEEHDMFAAIKWQPLAEVSKEYKDRTGVPALVSYFDLNNDSRSDIVVKFSGYFKDHLLDWFVFLNVEEDAFATYDYDDVLKNSAGRFPDEDSPPLADYTLHTPVRDKHGKALTSEGMGGWIVINPFLIKSTAYLALTDRGVYGASPSGEGFVIGKYKSPKELDEVCYFKQTTQAKKKRR